MFEKTKQFWTGFVSRRQHGVPTHPVGQIATVEEQEFGILDLGADISHALRLEMDKNILTNGEPFRSGGTLGPACLPVLGMSSAVSSSLLGGNVFLATASPATLMQIGGGVGSAVMGPGGAIVAHAPFIAAGSAILPVVAPVMFFMTVSAMMMSARFDQIQTALDQLAVAVQELMIREIAGDYGTLCSAMERLRDIEAEFVKCRRFTDEMKMRLALVERDVNILHHTYHFLSTRPVTSVTGANLAVTDLKLFTISSLADIQVDRLRLKLALQDNPDDVPRSLSVLNAKINRYETAFRSLLEEDAVRGYQKELQHAVEGMSWWKKNISARKDRKGLETDIKEIHEIRDDRLDTLRLNIARWSDDLAQGRDAGQDHAVLYYREQGGTGALRAYYTSDLQLVRQPA